jgi:Ca2+-binding RTX toxin-like protein
MRRVLIATAVIVMLTPAASARAAEVYAGGGDLFDFNAAPGERNDVTITTNALGVVVRDAGAPLTGVGPCVPLDAHTVICAGTTPNAPWNVVLDDLDDSVRFVHATQHATIDGGAGDDDLSAPDGGSTVWAGEGDDTVAGGAGPDSVSGGGGNDDVDPGLGSDWVTLGAGTSSVDVRDGAPDTVTCADGGTATVLTDPFDSVSAC